MTATQKMWPMSMHKISYCDEWNNKRITSLQEDKYECVAFDSKKDHCTELTTIDVSLKPQKTGNLRKVLHVKVCARVMLTTNIDVNDGLTNGAVGTVKYVITEEITKRVKVILVEFDNTDVWQDAKSKSLYTHINSKAVPICKMQAIFPVNGKTSFQASWTQFPLVLAWAITIHKCQGLTLPEIVVDMTLSKGHYTVGKAYVAFSRVTQLDKLHIINYTRKQIHVSQHAENDGDGEVTPKYPTTNATMSFWLDTERNISYTLDYWKLKKQTERYWNQYYNEIC